jgi:hypothetical protein
MHCSDRRIAVCKELTGVFVMKLARPSAGLATVALPSVEPKPQVIALVRLCAWPPNVTGDAVINTSLNGFGRTIASGRHREGSTIERFLYGNEILLTLSGVPADNWTGTKPAKLH